MVAGGGSFAIHRHAAFAKEKTMRKQILQPQAAPSPHEIPVASLATVLVSWEEKDHPIDHAFDDRRGPGGTKWIAGTGGEQTIILAFDAP